MADRSFILAALSATMATLRASPNGPRDFLRAAARWPLEYAVRAQIASTPAATLRDFAEGSLGNMSIDAALLARVSWNVRLDEAICLRQIVRSTKPRRAFEIGTFNGATSLLIAQEAGPESHVWTLDLPPDQFASGAEGLFGSLHIGQAFKDRPEEHRITQLYGNTETFDFSPWSKSMDLVFVDAAHDFQHGLQDSRTALRLARPGALILWHDYSTQWLGLVLGIRDATKGLPLRLLEGTTLAMLRVPGSDAAP